VLNNGMKTFFSQEMNLGIRHLFLQAANDRRCQDNVTNRGESYDEEL